MTGVVNNLYDARKKITATGVRVNNDGTITITGFNSKFSGSRAGTFSYVTNENTGDVAFINHSSPKWKNLVASLENLKGDELQAEFDRISRTKNATSFVKTSGEMHNYNSDVNKAIELEDQISSNSKLLDKYENTYGMFVKRAESQQLKPC